MNTHLEWVDMLAIAPLLILMGTSLLLLLIESFAKRVQTVTFWITLGSLIVAFIFPILAPASSSHPLLTPWLRFDALADFFTLFFIGIGIVSTLLSFPLFHHFKASAGEYYFLLLSSLFGLVLIGSAADFLTLFLGLEILSLSLYVMCSYMKTWELAHEAALKYFLLGSLAAAFLLYGIALIYGATGTTQFSTLPFDFRSLTNPHDRILFLSGIALITLGLAFKAAIVPFHFWAPDVYDGAPTPVTAFMAVGTKAGAFAAFILLFMIALPGFYPLWNQGIAWLAYPTLIYANLVAVRQKQLRRFFAYSGIAHAGFLLIPLAALTMANSTSQELIVSSEILEEAIQAMLFYLVVYAFATFGSFAVLVILDERREGVLLEDLQGLMRKNPWLAGIFSVCLLTLAGIPPTAGFFAKLYVFKLAFIQGYYGLVIVGLTMSVFAAFYYARMIAVMLGEEKEWNGEKKEEKEEKKRMEWEGGREPVLEGSQLLIEPGVSFAASEASFARLAPHKSETLYGSPFGKEMGRTGGWNRAKGKALWRETWPAFVVGGAALVGIIFLSVFPEELFKLLDRLG